MNDPAPRCYLDASIACDGRCGKLVLGGACSELLARHYERA
ncbi:MAG: hypothetical protein WDA16_02820 [Candidatus Thermoplasmatota archaeon]